ncbi:MAG TPA: hypothetical protein VEK57_04325 [Thermoanaerobaculia bacterium]|nr:hypothetical protein [Thermoanaerobaculia bacterium]
MLIPAERTAVPLVIRDGLPVAIGEPLTLGAGERETVRLSAPKAGHTDIAAWVRVDRSGGVDSTIDLPPPELEATAGATTVQLLVPLAGGLSSTQSLVFFRDVPIGPLQLVTGGKLWLHSEKPVEAQSGRVTAVRDPVLLVPAAALTLSWDLGTTNVQDEPCDVRSGPRPQPQLMATLERCLPSGCTPVVRERAAFTSRGVVAFEGIPAGDYQLQVVAPFAKSVSLEASLPAGRESMLSVPLKSFQFFGQVKLNGEPLRARLVFESGEALSDRTGRYTAVVAADPLTNSIRILPCDGTRAITWIPRERIAENSAFDIDLRTRTVRAKVIDSRGIPVSGAAVHFGTLQSETSDGIGYWSENTESDGDGHAVFESAPADKTLILCAEHAMHARVCSRFSSRDGQPAKEVVLQFEPVLARGKVVGHQGRATLAWVDRSGRITEEVSLAQEGDGGFILRQPHGRDEYLVYVSSARPLTVFSQPEPAPPGAELVVTLPTAPVRAFTVVIPPSTGDAFVGLWIGGRYVPLDLLVQHHDQRGSNVVPEGGKPLRFLDIAATGPIAVAYIPYLTMPGPFVDPFTRPEYANAERHVVAGAEVVIPPTASR